MPLTYFKCVDTLLTYCNKSIPEEPSLWFAVPLHLFFLRLEFEIWHTILAAIIKNFCSTIRQNMLYNILNNFELIIIV